MWEPRRLTTLWSSTVCYGDSFTLLVILPFYASLSTQVDPVFIPYVHTATLSTELLSVTNCFVGVSLTFPRSAPVNNVCS
jgi:hypothetical protein